MKISVFGIGYVGCVTAAALSRRKHTVVGVDINRQKVDAINQGKAPVLEKGLAELIEKSPPGGCNRRGC
jgi:GDP-mannose 6-dehydrogenase